MDPRNLLIFIQGLSNRPSSAAWLLKEYRESLPNRFRYFVWITKDQESAEERARDLKFFFKQPVVIYPNRFTLPYVHMIPDAEISAERISTLFEILEIGKEEEIHIITPVRALMEYTVPKDVLNAELEYLEEGEEVDRNAIERWLVESGYEQNRRVEKVGEFSKRGDILDIFPPRTKFPLRIIFFGDFIEEIRTFDPETQRSVGRVKQWFLLPCIEVFFNKDLVGPACERLLMRAESMGWSSEDVVTIMNSLREGIIEENVLSLLPIVYNKPETLFEYIGDDALFIMDEVSSIIEEATIFWERANSAYNDAKDKLPPPIGSLEEYILPVDALKDAFKKRPIAICKKDLSLEKTLFEIHIGQRDTVERIPRAPLELIPPTNISIISRTGKGKESIAPFLEHLHNQIRDGERIIVSCSNEKTLKRISSLLSISPEHQLLGLDSSLKAPIDIIPDDPGIYLVEGELSSGFSIVEKGITFLSEDEFLGTPKDRKKKSVSRTKARKMAPVELEELAPGDVVVHRDFGLGIFRALETVEAGGIPGEYLLLEYRDGDKLYLPVDRIGLLQRYKGLEDKVPRLDKLGGTSWELTKKRVKKAILEIANELVDLYALRQVQRGYAFNPPDAMYHEFEADFPYEDTADQERATFEILKDMESPKPMDRLLCGDVGYGKTEVAMRAAFLAVENGKQVGVLVPTTLLAEQHERTFRERFKRFPVKIAAISRLKSRKEQREILEGVRNGSIDIVIGTHRLLQADSTFKDLGLLIIDEEHRFGVRHKERLKQLKKNVDCLSLTATPIPRTLQLSLLGIRDLSVIETPPRDRRPVKTFLSEFDPPVVKDAFRRELERGGQIFYVYNRVKGIERMAERLKALVPEAKIDVAHGQMDESKLEDVMVRFIRGEIDCLVCTTIIESGIDIPSANTMLIHRADTLGLAQLYQLRGRVGRGAEQGYAYLLVPDIAKIPKDARKRLMAVLEMETKGGGLTLAMEDLKIRGAGNLLGTAQSGQIAKVGYDLFLELLKEAVDELKGVPPEESIHPEVNLKIPAYIPDEYCKDVSERLRLYRTISQCKNSQELEEKRAYLTDVYGPIPVETENLFELTELKLLLKKIHCVRLDEHHTKKDTRFILTFDEKGPPDLEKVVKFVKSGKGNLMPDGRLAITTSFSMFKEILRGLD